MEEQPVEKKILHISPSVQALIIDIPEAVSLLNQLTEEHGYEVQDVINYDDPEESTRNGVVGYIVTNDAATATNYIIYNADGVIEALSKILSPEKTHAGEFSPPVQRRAVVAPGYQAGNGTVNVRMSDGEVISVDAEASPRGQEERAEWGARFSFWNCCCNRFGSGERTLLLTPDPATMRSSK